MTNFSSILSSRARIGGLAAALLLASAGLAQAQVKLVAGASEAEGTVISSAVTKFAELVNQKSGGEITITPYYQSLGVEQQLAQAVKAGSVDIGQLSNGNAGRFTDAFLVYDLPFLFDSYPATLGSLLSPVGQDLVTRFEADLGVKFLFPVSTGGGRDVQTRSRAIKVPADIKGLKIRTVSTPVDIATFKAWGANPTPIDYSQTFASLQQGLVEGTQFAFSALPDIGYDEVLKYDLRIEYQGLFNTLYMNRAKYDALTDKQKQIVQEAANEAREWQWAFAAQKKDEAQKKLLDKGWQVYEPTAEERALWTAPREAIWKEVAAQLAGKIDLDLANRLTGSK